MKKHLLYLAYVLRHKWHVFIGCWRYGAPLWRGLTHDLSKLSPSEWLPYAEHFYGSAGDPAAWQQAWLLHQNRNDHHWQFWVLIWDTGETQVLPMTEPAWREMIADWYGAGMARSGRNDVVEWYLKNRERLQLHRKTRVEVEKTLLGSALDSLREGRKG